MLERYLKLEQHSSKMSEIVFVSGKLLLCQDCAKNLRYFYIVSGFEVKKINVNKPRQAVYGSQLVIQIFVRHGEGDVEITVPREHVHRVY